MAVTQTAQACDLVIFGAKGDLAGLILDSTGFAKPKVHAEGRLAS